MLKLLKRGSLKAVSLQAMNECPSSITSSGIVAKHLVLTQKVAQRLINTSSFNLQREFNQPLSANDMQRSGGIASFARLPIQEGTEGLDACFVGIPLDVGTSNRSGTRLGPRQIRCESVMLRPYNQATGAAPFRSLQVADIGDVAINTFNLPVACEQIRERYIEIIKDGCKPLTIGGDHTLSYPILQAIKKKYGTVALIHIDAHTDTGDTFLGAKIGHGTPFRRAVEEELIDPKATVQIGLRGPKYSEDEFEYGYEQGFKVFPAEDCWHKSLTPVMEEVRALIGSKPVYLSFDIDGIDPGFCPGTGTPEIAGLTPIQALEIVRGCKGLNLVGADLVEVSPPYDPQGTTALHGANLLFEMLCVLPGVKYTK